MSALLEIVAETAEDRVTAEREFRIACVMARTFGGHTLQAIADAAGLSKQRIGKLLQDEREDERR